MSVMEFEVHDRDDPNGSPICTITDGDVVFNKDGEAMEFRVGLNQEGAGLFNISRHHTLANQTDIPDNAYIKPIIPVVSSNPIFGWWADEFRAKLISSDEQGGETVAIFGPGIIDILRRAILWDIPYAPAQPARGSLDMPGKWHWINEPRGAILTRGIEEGQEQGGEPLRHVTIDFTRTTSSAPESATWAVTDSIFEETIGIDIHALYKQLIAAGDLIVVPEPSLLIHAYQAYGEDLTADVFFAKAGVSAHPGNIITDLTRTGRGTRKATHGLVRGKDETYYHVQHPDYAGEPGQALFIPYDATDQLGLLQGVGDETLRQRKDDTEGIEFEITPGFDPENGLYMPGPPGTNGHFWVGSVVTVITGTDSNRWEEVERSRVVTGIRFLLAEAAKDDTEETAARSLRIVVECGGVTQDGPPQVPQPRIQPVGLQWEFDNCAGEGDRTLTPGTWLLTLDPNDTNLTLSGTQSVDYHLDGGPRQFILRVLAEEGVIPTMGDNENWFALKLPDKPDPYYDCSSA